MSYEYEEQKIYQLTDFLIRGAADTAFHALCCLILKKHKTVDSFPKEKIFAHQEPVLDKLKLPYQYYTEEDIKNRVLYVEASRGCPFKCEFCLSALDKTSLPFDIDVFLKQMEDLYNRGARNFKFVDRTFNLKIQTSLKILDFFLERLDERLFLHFEIIPDRLPSALKETIAKFPEGCLQFELGVQSFNPQVQSLISRKQDNEKTQENLNWLKDHSRAHIHADLIFALPGEDLNSFASGFNQLYELKPHDIQLGILKRLRGTPVIRHSEEYQLIFEPTAPYSILATRQINFALIQRVSRFARYWELLANSGHFKNSLKILLADQAFEHFLAFSDWLYEYSGKTHQISLRRLYDYLYYGYKALGEESLNIKHGYSKDQYGSQNNIINTTMTQALLEDYKSAGLKGVPEFYKTLVL